MKRKTSCFRIFLILFLILSGGIVGCRAEATSAPTVESPPQPPTEPIATVIPTAILVPTPAPTLNAILQEVEGGVEAKEEIDVDFSIAENGTLLHEDGQIRTLEDGYTRVDLSTGTLIRMAPLSYFTLVSNQPKNESLLTRIKLEVGQLWVVLNGGSVEIETPAGQAAVRGSYMMVEIDPETQEILIACLEGYCELENAAGIIQMVSGQRAKFNALELPIIEAMTERDFAEWLFFVPEAQEIFPLLQELGILPWEDWERFLPDEDGILPDLDELFPDGGGLPDPPGGEGLPDPPNGVSLPNLPGG